MINEASTIGLWFQRAQQPEASKGVQNLAIKETTSPELVDTEGVIEELMAKFGLSREEILFQAHTAEQTGDTVSKEIFCDKYGIPYTSSLDSNGQIDFKSPIFEALCQVSGLQLELV